VGDIVVPGVIIIIIFILIKKGLIRVRTTTYGKYVLARTENQLDVSYKKFDGLEYYFFNFKKGQQITMNYLVFVERGALTIELKNKNREVFSKRFESSEQGEYTFVAENKRFSIDLVGEDTIGSCKITFGS
jgi:hypothetical protein